MHFEIKKGYVELTAEGIVDSYSLFLMGTRWMYDIITKTKTEKALLDYRKITFKLEQTEAFNIVRVYELEMPLMSNVKLATVVGPQMKNLAAIWEEIGRRRGFNFAVFTSMDEAESWLNNN